MCPSVKTTSADSLIIFSVLFTLPVTFKNALKHAYSWTKMCIKCPKIVRGWELMLHKTVVGWGGAPLASHDRHSHIKWPSKNNFLGPTLDGHCQFTIVRGSTFYNWDTTRVLAVVVAKMICPHMVTWLKPMSMVPIKFVQLSWIFLLTRCRSNRKQIDQHQCVILVSHGDVQGGPKSGTPVLILG